MNGTHDAIRAELDAIDDAIIRLIQNRVITCRNAHRLAVPIDSPIERHRALAHAARVAVTMGCPVEMTDSVMHELIIGSSAKEVS